MGTGGEIFVGLVIALGLVGVVTQVLPGSFLVLGAIGVWAAVTGGTAAWAVLGVSAVAIIAANVIKYVFAHRHLSAAGVPNSSIWWGGLGGIIGFFLIPFVGLFVGFPVGVYLAEWRRRKDSSEAWVATKVAVAATGITILVELAGALVAIAAWIAGLIAT